MPTVPGQKSARLRAPVEGGVSDGKLGRQFSDAMGEEVVELARKTSEFDNYPRIFGYRPNGMPGVLLHRGEFIEHTHRRQDRLRLPETFPLPKLAGGGFASLSDIISEVSVGGKGQQLIYQGKVGTATATAGIGEYMWYAAGMPGAGAAPGNLTAGGSAAGTIPTNATAGCLAQSDPAGGDTSHLLSASGFVSTAAPAMMILHDLLWYGRCAASSSGTQTVTGVPTRYTGTAAAGNVISAGINSTLGAVAHNMTVTYTDQGGTTAQTTGAVAGINAGAANRLNFNTVGQWAFPLAAGDTGVRNIETFTYSVATVTGALDIMVARPLCFIPCPLAGIPGFVDGINSAFNLVEIKTGACLAFWGIKGAATASPLYSAQVMLGSG